MTEKFTVLPEQEDIDDDDKKLEVEITNKIKLNLTLAYLKEQKSEIEERITKAEQAIADSK